MITMNLHNIQDGYFILFEYNMCLLYIVNIYE